MHFWSSNLVCSGNFKFRVLSFSNSFYPWQLWESASHFALHSCPTLGQDAQVFQLLDLFLIPNIAFWNFLFTLINVFLDLSISALFIAERKSTVFFREERFAPHPCPTLGHGVTGQFSKTANTYHDLKSNCGLHNRDSFRCLASKPNYEATTALFPISFSSCFRKSKKSILFSH